MQAFQPVAMTKGKRDRVVSTIGDYHQARFDGYTEGSSSPEAAEKMAAMVKSDEQALAALSPEPEAQPVKAKPARRAAGRPRGSKAKAAKAKDPEVTSATAEGDALAATTTERPPDTA